MKFRLFAVLIAANALIGSAANQAHAEIITYSNQGAWLGAVTDVVGENFDSFTSGTSVAALPALGVTFDDLVPGEKPRVFQDEAASTFTSSFPIFLANAYAINVSATGALSMRFAAGIGALSYFAAGGDEDVHLIRLFDINDNQLNAVFSVTAGATFPVFFGFTSDVLVHRMEVQPGLASGNTFLGFDDLQIGNVAITPSVPEPCTFVLATVGLLALGGVKFRPWRMHLEPVMNRLLCILTLSLAVPAAAHADFIGGSHLTPSTGLASVSPFTIDQINDTITSDNPPFNGFASPSPSGTITFDLDQVYDLNGFVLWNDINVLAEGIAHFSLDFFDNALGFLGSTGVFFAPQGQGAPSTYNFATVSGVRRVNLEVIDSHFGVVNQIEIREVGFLTPSAVPEPASVILLGCGSLGLFTFRSQARRRRASDTACSKGESQ